MAIGLTSASGLGMQLQSTSSAQSLHQLGLIEQRFDRSLQTLSRGTRVDDPSTGSIRWNTLHSLRERLAALESADETLSRAATTARFTQEAATLQSRTLDQMLSTVHEARTQPEGSHARQHALESYAELREHLRVNLNVPDRGARTLIAPSSPQQQLTVNAGPDGFQFRLQARDIGPGAGGLNVPELGMPPPDSPGEAPVVADSGRATDAELDALVGYLSDAKEALDGHRAAFAADFIAIERAAERVTTDMYQAGEDITGAEETDLHAEAMVAQSVSLRYSLALQGLNSMQETRSLTLGLLNYR